MANRMTLLNANRNARISNFNREGVLNCDISISTTTERRPCKLHFDTAHKFTRVTTTFLELHDVSVKVSFFKDPERWGATYNMRVAFDIQLGPDQVELKAVVEEDPSLDPWLVLGTEDMIRLANLKFTTRTVEFSNGWTTNMNFCRHPDAVDIEDQIPPERFVRFDPEEFCPREEGVIEIGFSS